MLKKLKHMLGLCHKTRLGYTCYGNNNYKECD